MSNVKLNDYLKALNSIHENDLFWVLDDKYECVHANSQKYDLESLAFYCILSDKLLSWNELKLKLQKLENNKPESIEVIAIVTGAQENKGLLMEIMQLNDNDKTLGVLILNYGSVNNFEYTSLLSRVFIGNSKRLSIAKNLSIRELEVIYFIIRGCTYEEIATYISKIYNKNITASAIGKVVRNSLYEKFNVWNKHDLKNALFKSKYVNRIPVSVYFVFLKLNNL